MKSYCAPKENETFVYTRGYSMHILDTYNWNEPCLSLLPGSFLRTPDTGVVVGYSNNWEIQSGEILNIMLVLGCARVGFWRDSSR